MRIEPYTDISGKQEREMKFVTKILWKHKNTNRIYLQFADEIC